MASGRIAAAWIALKPLSPRSWPTSRDLCADSRQLGWLTSGTESTVAASGVAALQLVAAAYGPSPVTGENTRLEYRGIGRFNGLRRVFDANLGEEFLALAASRQRSRHREARTSPGCLPCLNFQCFLAVNARAKSRLLSARGDNLTARPLARLPSPSPVHPSVQPDRPPPPPPPPPPLLHTESDYRGFGRS